MNRISYSQISLFNECPQHWKLRYVDKISKTESNIYLIFGTAMHEVLQTYLEVMYNDSIKNADKLNLEDMLRDKLIEQLHILNGIAMYLRGKQGENGTAPVEDLTRTEEYPEVMIQEE